MPQLVMEFTKTAQLKSKLPVSEQEVAAPFRQHSATSQEAAQQIKPDSSRLRAIVLAKIQQLGGCTDEEGIDATGINPSTYRPRRVELVEAKKIKDSGQKKSTRSGRPATVWVLA